MLPAPSRVMLAALLTLAMSPGLVAQGDPTERDPTERDPTERAPASLDFRTPDGSRFVLIADPTMRHVEWTIATPADPAEDPPGLEGLAVTVAIASLGGTWTTGSVDAARERAALDRLDVAWGQIFATKGSQEAQAELLAAKTECDQLGDTAVFRRVLAALPVNRPEVLSVGPATVLQMTTVPEALGDVSDLILERREQQVLRALPQVWADELTTRQRAFDANPRNAVYTELLNLALPGHPAIRAFERPGVSSPRRAQALAAWARTQHPSRSVHVLIGGFAPAALRSLLERKFATTALPAPEPTVPAAMRAIASERRSTVPGSREPLVAIAWQLPPGQDPLVLNALASWLAGPEGRIPLALRRAGRDGVAVRATAPWPPAFGTAGLLLVELSSNDTKDLADAVLQACRDAAKEGPSEAEVQALGRELELAASAVAADPRWLARDLAVQLLRWPGQPLRNPVAQRLSEKTLRPLVNNVLGSRPVVAEARR